MKEKKKQASFHAHVHNFLRFQSGETKHRARLTARLITSFARFLHFPPSISVSVHQSSITLRAHFAPSRTFYRFQSAGSPNPRGDSGKRARFDGLIATPDLAGRPPLIARRYYNPSAYNFSPTAGPTRDVTGGFSFFALFPPLPHFRTSFTRETTRRLSCPRRMRNESSDRAHTRSGILARADGAGLSAGEILPERDFNESSR